MKIKKIESVVAAIGLVVLTFPHVVFSGGTGMIQTLRAVDYGVVANGLTDDGPAIASMLDAARAIENPVVLLFPSNQNIYVESLPGRYVFPLDGVSNLTLDGAGSTFLLDSYIRFLDLKNSTNINVSRLNVDFFPLPFVDGLVVDKSITEKWIEVDVPIEDVDRVLGSSDYGNDGEQSFFSMLWNEGPYDLISVHYWTTNIINGSGSGRVRVYTDSDASVFDSVEPGVTQVSIPVPGIAHRFGPGACFEIINNNGVAMEDVELWSAPWFGFSIRSNEGDLSFKRVNIRPKPGSNRLLSVWRDGFHVKGNRSSLLWEDCTISYMGDDAFNISTHSRRVKEILSPTSIIIEQKFVLFPIPWTTADIASAVDPDTLRLRGSAIVTQIDSTPSPQGESYAPLLTVELNQAIPGLTVGDTIWQPISTNPDTTLRRCTIKMSCRMQGPVTLEDCDVTALLWFYGNDIEGPFPSNVKISNCRLRRGRGNPTYAVVFSGMPTTSPVDNIPPRAIHDISILSNDIYGGFVMQGVENFIMEGNRFLEAGASIVISDNHQKTLGEYTFNDLGSGSVAERMPIALQASSVAAGASFSILGTNTTPQLDFVGFANVPSTVNDGFGFGDNLGQHVMFLKRADGGHATAWGAGGSTAATHTPFSFTVTADAGYSISVESFTMTSTGAMGSPALWAFQEENTTQGAFILDGGNASSIMVDLAAPVIIAEGTSKTFTISIDSYVYSAQTYLDSLAINGAILEENVSEAHLVGISLVSGNVIKLLAVGASSVLNKYHPISTTDLTGTWAEVAHSDGVTNAYAVTNLDYSAVEGTNVVIYVKSEEAAEFFRIEIQ